MTDVLRYLLTGSYIALQLRERSPTSSPNKWGRFVNRNTNLDEFLFPVELRDLYYTGNRPRQLQLDIGNSRPGQKRIPGYRMVINCETDEPISLVTEGYRLVSNQEALALAEQC